MVNGIEVFVVPLLQSILFFFLRGICRWQAGNVIGYQVITFFNPELCQSLKGYSDCVGSWPFRMKLAFLKKFVVPLVLATGPQAMSCGKYFWLYFVRLEMGNLPLRTRKILYWTLTQMKRSLGVEMRQMTLRMMENSHLLNQKVQWEENCQSHFLEDHFLTHRHR